MKAVLFRHYMPEATHGLLTVNGKVICKTIELPWISNQKMISCIPEGTYSVVKRYSPKFKEHFELLDVPNRSLILIHPANNAKRELKGCIAPVTEFLAEGWGKRSREAMDHVKLAFYSRLLTSTVDLTIVKTTDENSINILTQF